MSKLSSKALQLLVQASKSSDGHIRRVRTIAGLSINTDNQQFVTQQDTKSEASWQAALNDLWKAGLVEPTGAFYEVFRITRQGYEQAEKLSE